MIKACIFDLDGVIVDTAHYHFLAWKRLADELGIAFTPEDNERLKGVSRMHSMDILLEIGGKQMNHDEKEKFANKKNTWFVEHVERMLPEEIFSGVKILVQELHANRVKVGLASSSKNAQRVLELLQIKDQFDTIVDGTMITHSKPDPEIFLLAASRLQVDPKDCLVFEDAEAGVEAALAAGMKCIGVGSADQLFKADKIIKATGDFKFNELEQFNK